MTITLAAGRGRGTLVGLRAGTKEAGWGYTWGRTDETTTHAVITTALFEPLEGDPPRGTPQTYAVVIDSDTPLNCTVTIVPSLLGRW